MPTLKEKPVLKAKPPCGGCDFCGDLREDGLYALGYDGKYRCHKCFHRVAQGWPKSGWLGNESGFREQLDEGHRWETVVYERLKADLEPYGIPVTMTPKSLRENVRDRGKYRQEEDINIGPYRVEVHARKYGFTSKRDHPKECEIMTPCKKVERWGERRPMCFMIISKETGGILVASVQKTQSEWKRWAQKDPVRGYTEDVYGCPVRLMTEYDEFIQQIKEKMGSERRLEA